MIDRWIHGRLLLCAARLSYFFLGNERDVRAAILRAARRLDVALQQQYKRMKSNSRHPSVTNLPTDNLYLACLIDAIDDIIEKSDRIHNSDLTFLECALFFLLCCIRNARHHSFHLAIALGRVLHWYQTPEVQRIYEEQLAGDPKEDYQYREIKRDLIQALKVRFGDLLQQSREKNGEARFASAAVDDSEWQIIAAGLDLLAVWDHTHFVLGSFDNTVHQDWNDPDILHALDRRRMHALTCSGCFDSLMQAAGLAAPRSRIAMPSFSGPKGPVGRGENLRRHAPPEWMSSDWLQNLRADIDSVLQEQQEVRCEWAGGPIRLEIVAAGLKRVIWQGRWQSVQMDPGTYSDTIEISGTVSTRQVLLGYLPLNLIGRQHRESETITIALGRAYEINLKLTFYRIAADASVQISLKYASLSKPGSLTIAPRENVENGGAQLVSIDSHRKSPTGKDADSRSPPEETTPHDHDKS